MLNDVPFCAPRSFYRRDTNVIKSSSIDRDECGKQQTTSDEILSHNLQINMFDEQTTNYLKYFHKQNY